MQTGPFQRSATAILVVMAVSACSRSAAPTAIVSLSPQTTAIVHQLGAADLMLTATDGARDLSGDIAVRISEWLSGDGRGMLVIFGLEHDASDLPATIIGNPRITLALYPGCNIIDVFAMYQEMGAILSTPEVAAAHIRSISSELGRISGATLGLRRPSVVVVDWNNAAHSGVGLVGDMIEIGGGEHLLEFAGPPCGFIDYSLWDGPAAEVLIAARSDAPQLMWKLENLKLVEAAREVRAALFPDNAEFQTTRESGVRGSGVSPR